MMDKSTPLELQTVFVKILIMLGVISAVLSDAQAQRPSQRVQESAVQSFCSMDLSGKRLTPGGAKEFAKDLVAAEPTWEQPSEVVVIQDYSAQGLSVRQQDAQFAVEYHVLGRIDSSLEFMRLQTPYTNQPVVQSEHFSVVLTDTHFEVDANGHPQAIKQTPEWRIKTAPAAPHVSVLVAIQYVRGVSSRTKDPLLKARALKTLADLEVLTQFQPIANQTTAPLQQQPEDILSQFIQMQMDGAGLNTDGSLGIFLVHPAQWRRDKIGVARGFGVRRTAFAVNKAEVYAQYDAVGEVDLQLRLTSAGGSGSAVRQSYKLIFDNDYSSLSTGSAPYDKIGPSRWRIEEDPPEQWVSVATAIRYITQMRDATRDPSIKANADKTLAILARYR
jgi:hypothetical protein